MLGMIERMLAGRRTESLFTTKPTEPPGVCRRPRVVDFPGDSSLVGCSLAVPGRRPGSVERSEKLGST